MRPFTGAITSAYVRRTNDKEDAKATAWHLQRQTPQGHTDDYQSSKARHHCRQCRHRGKDTTSLKTGLPLRKIHGIERSPCGVLRPNDYGAIMSSNTNLKWQQCTDLGYRRSSRNDVVEASPPGNIEPDGMDHRQGSDRDGNAAERPDAPVAAVIAH